MAKYKIEEVICESCGETFKCRPSDPEDLCECPKCLAEVVQEQVTLTVNDLVDDAFSQMVSEYKLAVGDIAPEQQDAVDDIKEKLTAVLVAYVKQNSKQRGNK